MHCIPFFLSLENLKKHLEFTNIVIVFGWYICTGVGVSMTLFIDERILAEETDTLPQVTILYTLKAYY